MRDSTRNQGRIFRKPTAGGLVLLLVLSGLPVPASAEGKIQHWSKVQEVTPGTEIKVELYKDQVHRGRRKIQGRFHSATDDSITLKRKDGQTQTLQRSAVRKVHTRRRGYSKRWFPLWPVVAERKIKPDWSKVRTVTPGTEIKLGLYKDQVHRGRRKIQGRFHSATDDSITLTLKDGQTHTLQRSAVRKVHTRRGKGWFPLGDILWSRVQSVTPGTRTTVELYKDQAPRGSQKIEGHFHSATDDSITLRLKGGQRRTLQKSAVRKVLAYRPFGKRTLGWITAGVSSAVSLPLLARPAADLTAFGVTIYALPFIVLPTAIVLLVTSKEKVYSVPPQHRTRPPGDQQSGSVGKASGKQEDQ